MSETLKDFTSPHWWITVVVAGLVLNVFSSYLREWMDRFLASFSSGLRSWTKKKGAEFDDDIQRATGNLPLLTFLAARQASYHLSAIQFFAVSFFANYWSRQLNGIAWLSAILGWLGFLLTLLASADLGRAGRCRTIVDAAQKNFPNKPNKAPEPTTTSVTSPAAQEPRQP